MKMYNRKGQAALEFMMTYGWAILVVLAAIGALSYFGILDPSRFTPDTCLASSGFACPGKPIVTSNNLTLSIVNGLGYKVVLNTTSTYDATGDGSRTSGDFITLSNLVCNNTYVCPQGTQCNNPATNRNMTVQDGAGATLFLTNCDFSETNVVKGTIDLIYVNTQSGLKETLKVSVTTKPK